MSKRKINEKTRTKVEKRADFKCEYCKSPMLTSTQRFEIEHVKPISLGGRTILKNLALACRGCNGHKYNKTNSLDEVSGETVDLFNPRKDRWNNHFAWDTEVEFFVGLTAKGRASINALKLNRKQLIGLRRFLIKNQLHPPTL